MHPPQGLQMPVVEALHAHRQAGDPRFAVGAEAVALEGARVGLQGDLGLGLQPHAGTHIGQ